MDTIKLAAYAEQLLLHSKAAMCCILPRGIVWMHLFARVGRHMYLIPYLILYKYVLQEVAISPTSDFWIFLDAKLWKAIPKI